MREVRRAGAARRRRRSDTHAFKNAISGMCATRPYSVKAPHGHVAAGGSSPATQYGVGLGRWCGCASTRCAIAHCSCVAQMVPCDVAKRKPLERRVEGGGARTRGPERPLEGLFWRRTERMVLVGLRAR